jgi:hypothetical protein
MAEADDDVPYLMRGVTRMMTDSSVLISSSEYLNDAELRDWIAYVMLRRNGADDPPENERTQLVRILARVQDAGKIEGLIAAERKTNAAFDAWMAEGFVSSFTKADLARCPPGSVGGLLAKAVAEGAHGAAIAPAREVKGPYDYILLRRAQTRFLEHIVCGAGFDHFGEAVTHFVHLANLFEHLGSDLAGELAVFHMLAALRYMPRTILHYPHVTMTLLQSMVRARKFGLASGPLFMARYEDVLTLSPQMARTRLGFAPVEPVDTAQASAFWAEATCEAPPKAVINA